MQRSVFCTRPFRIRGIRHTGKGFCIRRKGQTMDDLIWFNIIGILFVLIGFAFFGLGWAIGKKQRIDLIIRHHMDKVSEENKPAFCRLSGTGATVIGIGFVCSGIWTLADGNLFSFLPMAIGLAVGIVLLAAAGIRYNRQ